MTTDAGPTESEWSALDDVTLHYKHLVDDEPAVVRASESVKGTIGQANAPSTRSKFKAYLDQFGGQPFFAFEERVATALPRIDELGGNPTERTANLKIRLEELAAYRWLRKQAAYRSALKTIEVRSKRSLSYARDDAELRVLRALVGPLRQVLLYQATDSEPLFPTKDEVREAYQKVAWLQRFFFKSYFPLTHVFNMPQHFYSVLPEVVEELRFQSKKYRKPKDDGTLRERHFRDRLIYGLKKEFNECSPTLLSHLLLLAGYNPDNRIIKRSIKEALMLPHR